jgi:23S rRNA (pseudouridine1915-N3)-methyltransferase
MIKLDLLFVGKESRGWEEEGCREYLHRLKGHWDIKIAYVKHEKDLPQKVIKGAIFCDPQGQEMDSPAFSQFIYSELEKQGSRLQIVVGGSDGIDKEVSKNGVLISFSKMTFPHQLFRLLLLEQLYRAHEIRRNSPYHK